MRVHGEAARSGPRVWEEGTSRQPRAFTRSAFPPQSRFCTLRPVTRYMRTPQVKGRGEGAKRSSGQELRTVPGLRPQRIKNTDESTVDPKEERVWIK